MASSRFLKVATVSSATIALAAGSLFTPAFAAPQDTASDPKVIAIKQATYDLADGYLITTADSNVAQDGTPSGFFTIGAGKIDDASIGVENTTMTVGDEQAVQILAPSAVAEVTQQNGVTIAGYWTSSDDAVLTVDELGNITAVEPGTASLTFTPLYVQDGAIIDAVPVLGTEITVEAAAQEPAPEVTPAPEQTPAPEVTPAPEETPAPEQTPAPVETPAPEQTPVPEQTPAPVETPAPVAPVESQAPAPAPVAPVESVAPVAAPVTPVQPEVQPAADPASTEFIYENCAAVWDATGGPITSSDYGYGVSLDSDRDGVACETRPDYVNEAGTSDAGYTSENVTWVDSSTTSGSADYAQPTTYSVNAAPSDTSEDTYYYAASYDSLAHTGINAYGIFAGGLALLGLGTVAVVFSRRRGA